MTTSPNNKKSNNSHDLHRPQYHYLPASNWMNDPNGVIQWEGRYHLFYQYNPYGANHANMHWGHAVSDDMVHWEELPVAIAPTPDSYDRGGIFSGCMVDNDGTPTVFYTGVNDDYSVQVQCIATGSSDLLTWEKHDQNPVIEHVPPELQQTRDTRDPFVWQEEDGWYMVVGSRIEGIGGAILLYRSDNLTDWEYLHPLLVGESARNGIMFECPNFFKMGDKWVLIISSHLGHTTGTVLYFVGRYENHKFIPETEGVLDSGYYYAPLSHLDDQGRRILWSWIREGRTQEQYVNAGWSGVQAVPRILSLDEDNRLLMSPVPECEHLRGTHHQFTADTLDENVLPISSLNLDIHVSFKKTTELQYGIEVARSDDGQEKVTIFYDTSTQTLRIQRHYAHPNPDCDSTLQGLPHYLSEGETLDLRILLDGSVIEVIANQRTSITSRFYPTQAESQHVRVINPETVNELDIWEMSAIR
jgi:beta-fructofuranosidase